jgi:glycosyltransferase involved in cell wall biosynthesis
MLLSAALIVRDEAEHLDACLASLGGLVDEIVVVDTGSRDDSLEVAQRHGAVIGHEAWESDFLTPRNRALDLASGDWILYIDADERVRPADHATVRDLLAAATDHVSFRVRFVPVGCQNSITPLTYEFAGACRRSGCEFWDS